MTQHAAPLDAARPTPARGVGSIAPLRSERRSGLGIALLIESDGPAGAERMLLQLAVALRDRGHAVCPDPAAPRRAGAARSEEHTSELQSRLHLVCRLLLEKKKNT